MMLIFIVKAFVMGGYVPSEGAEINEYSKGSIFDSISIILTSYGFFINFYPIYSSLDNPTNKNAMKATGLAMAFCFVTYISFSHLGILSYGANVHPNIFENISAEGASVMSVFIVGVFIGIFLCNIPFNFLPGKEAFLVMLDELHTRSMSLDLTRRMDIQRKGTLLQGNQSTMMLDTTVVPQLPCISDRVPASTYYAVTLSLFTVQMVFAVLIDDITILFGFFAAISESMVNFILPGLFYICSCKVARIKPDPLWQAIASIYVVMGSSIFVMANANNIIKIMSA